MTTDYLSSRFVDSWASGFDDPDMFAFAREVGVDMYLQDNLTNTIDLLKLARTKGQDENIIDREMATLTTKIIQFSPNGLGFNDKTYASELGEILNIIHHIRVALEWYMEKADDHDIIDGATDSDANENTLLKTYSYCKNKYQHIDIMWHMAIVKLVRKATYSEYLQILPMLFGVKDLQYKKWKANLPEGTIPTGKITIEHTWE